MIVICTGGCDFEDKNFVSLELSKCLVKYGDWFQVFVGDSQGVDKFVREWCEEYEVKYTVFNAQWNMHGKPAGPIRNQTMVDAAIHIAPTGKIIGLAFPGGRGTKHCHDYMKKRGIKVWNLSKTGSNTLF